MHVHRILAPAIALTVLLAPAFAEEHRNTIRFGAQYVSPTGDYGETIETTRFTLEAVDAFGPFLSYERMITPRFGIEPTLGYTKHDVDLAVLDIESAQGATVEFGQVDVLPLVVGANFHFPAGTGADFYVGPQVGYVLFGDLESDFSSETLPISDGFAWGAVAGFDLPFGNGKWGFHGRFQLLRFAAEVDDPEVDADIDVDPLVVGVGVLRRF